MSFGCKSEAHRGHVAAGEPDWGHVAAGEPGWWPVAAGAKPLAAGTPAMATVRSQRNELCKAKLLKAEMASPCRPTDTCGYCCLS